MLVHNDKIALGGVRGDKFIFGAIRWDKQLFDTSVITDANKEYILDTYGEEALAKALVYLHGNPSFIPLFNEDPDTICSVCEIGWLRGNALKINLEFNPTKKTAIKCWMMDTDTSNSERLFGVRNGTSITNKSYTFGARVYNGWWENNGINISGYYKDCSVNTPYSIDYRWGRVYIQNIKTGAKQEYDTQVSDEYVPTGNGFGINGEVDYNYSNSLRYLNNFYIYEDGIKKYHIIPFKRNGVYCQLDMLNFQVLVSGNANTTEVRRKINE